LPGGSGCVLIRLLPYLATRAPHAHCAARAVQACKGGSPCPDVATRHCLADPTRQGASSARARLLLPRGRAGKVDHAPKYAQSKLPRAPLRDTRRVLGRVSPWRAELGRCRWRLHGQQLAEVERTAARHRRAASNGLGYLEELGWSCSGAHHTSIPSAARRRHGHRTDGERQRWGQGGPRSTQGWSHRSA